MELKLRRIQPEDKGILKHNRKMSMFIRALTNPVALTPLEFEEAIDWFVGLVIVPEDEDEKKYRQKAKNLIEDLSMDEILDLIQKFELKIEPDPK